MPQRKLEYFEYPACPKCDSLATSFIGEDFVAEAWRCMQCYHLFDAEKSPSYN